MDSRSHRFVTRFVAPLLVALVAFGAGAYWLSGLESVADTPQPLSPAQQQAIEHANALSEAFRTAAERVLPAVVAIHHEFKPKVVRRDVRPRPAPRLPREFEELDPLLKRFFEDMPGLEEFDMPNFPQQSSGSGVIIDKSGVILTNNHVVAGGGKITVTLHDGRQFVATDVKTDPNTEIAVVKIKADEPLPVALLGDSDKLRVGDWVLALGQPFGLQDTLTAGIISAKQRTVGISLHAEYLQTDAAINPGNSGGPLVNLHGEVVGINTAISTNSGGFQGVGFAVPVNVAKWVSSQLLKDGKVRRAYLGVGIQAVTPDLAEQFNLKTPAGALVTDVMPGSPAEKAGIKPQDVIVGFGGQPVQNNVQLYALAGRAPIGSQQTVEILRDGKRLELTVTMKETPPNYGIASRSSDQAPTEPSEGKTFENLGIEVGPLTDDVARQLGLRDTAGVLITGVAEGSPAALAGLEPSMAITPVGRQKVRNVAEFQAAMKDVSLEKGVLLLVRTAQGSRFVVIRQSSG
jgi:serine protease Do